MTLKHKLSYIVPVFAGMMAISEGARAQQQAQVNQDDVELSNIINVNNFAGDDGKRVLQGAQSAFFFAHDMVLIRSDTTQYRNGTKEYVQKYQVKDVTLTAIKKQYEDNREKIVSLTLSGEEGSVELEALSRQKEDGRELSTTGMTDDGTKNVPEMCRQAAFEIVRCVEERLKSDNLHDRYRRAIIPGTTIQVK